MVSLGVYPEGIFHLALAIGVYFIRYRYKRLRRGAPDFRVWDVVLIFYILLQVYIIATPWIPPKDGPYSGEVSFWYATYCVVGIAIIVLCGIYYIFWMYLLPRLGGYKVRPEILSVEDNGANTHRLVKVPLDEVAKWDEEHDEAGRLRRRRAVGSAESFRGEDGIGQESKIV